MDELNKQPTTIDDLLKDLSKPPEQNFQAIPQSGLKEKYSPLPQSGYPSNPPLANQPLGEQKPLAPAAAAPLSGAKEYQTVLRTMADDIEKLESGQTLLGLEVQSRTAVLSKPGATSKISSTPAKPVIGSAGTSQNLPLEMPENSQSDAGTPRAPAASYIPGAGLKDDKGRTLAHERVPMKEELPRPSIVANVINILFSVNKRVLLMVVGGIVLIAGTYFGLKIINREPEIVITTPTPRPTQVPSAKTDLNAIFGTISKHDYKPQTFNTAGAYSEIGNQQVSKGQFRKFNFISPSTSNTLGFSEILEALAAEYPSEITQYLGDDSMSLIYSQKELLDLSGQPVASGSFNRLVLIVEVKDLAKINEILTVWSPKIAMGLAPILNIDKNSASNSAISLVTYSGIVIRYTNFPFPDKTIDYAVIPASNKKNYLVITNSRESMHSTINKLKAI